MVSEHTAEPRSASQDYLTDENIAVKFGVQFCDMEDPRLRGQPTSTYLHFAILPREA